MCYFVTFVTLRKKCKKFFNFFAKPNLFDVSLSSEVACCDCKTRFCTGSRTSSSPHAKIIDSPTLRFVNYFLWGPQTIFEFHRNSHRRIWFTATAKPVCISSHHSSPHQTQWRQHLPGNPKSISRKRGRRVAQR